MSGMPPTLLIVYCIVITLASLVGGWLPSFFRPTHVRMQLAMSFAGGLMLGVAVLHLLPHAIAESNSVNLAVAWTLIGMLAMFFMIRVFHVHEHGHHDPSFHSHPPEMADSQDPHACTQTTPGGQRNGSSGISSLGLFVGLGLHTLIDGSALAASVAGGIADHQSGLVGLGIFMAVLLHKPLDALAITSLMAAQGWSQARISRLNLAFALICPIGAFTFFIGVSQLSVTQPVIGAALGFSAGMFLCIALADVLPEVQFHRHDRIKLSAAILAGVMLAVLIGIWEPEHEHPSGALPTGPVPHPPDAETWRDPHLQVTTPQAAIRFRHQPEPELPSASHLQTLCLSIPDGEWAEVGGTLH